MSGVNEIRFLVQYEQCECKCGLNESVSNSKEKWSHNECKCEYKKLDNWSSCRVELCGILVHVTVNVIKHVKLTNIQILKIAHAQKTYNW